MQTKTIKSTSPLSDFNDSDTVFVIEDPINLNPNQSPTSLTITLGAHSILSFTDDGSISNGTIIGNLSSIDFVGQKNRLSNIILQGTWIGPIRDLIFAYDTSPDIKPTFNKILNNLLLFRKIDLRRSEYFLEWPAVNSPFSISEDTEIDGNGATIYLSSNKGNTSTGPS